MSDSNSGSVGSGIGIGTVLAVIMSWSVNHSVIWAILHGICSWIYVLYWILTYKDTVVP